MKVELRRPGKGGGTATWIAEAQADGVTVRFGSTGKALQSKHYPLAKCPRGDPDGLVTKLCAEKMAEGKNYRVVAEDRTPVVMPSSSDPPTDNPREGCLTLRLPSTQGTHAAVIEVSALFGLTIVSNEVGHFIGDTATPLYAYWRRAEAFGTGSARAHLHARSDREQAFVAALAVRLKASLVRMDPNAAQAAVRVEPAELLEALGPKLDPATRTLLREANLLEDDNLLVGLLAW